VTFHLEIIWAINCICVSSRTLMRGLWNVLTGFDTEKERHSRHSGAGIAQLYTFQMAWTYTRFSAFSFRRHSSILCVGCCSPKRSMFCSVLWIQHSLGLPSACAYYLTSYRKAEILNATRTQ
jgi:hypothetical protein